MRKKAAFKVGDWVAFERGGGRAVARIIEDRGCIGSKGRRLYRVELPLRHTEPAIFEMPEEGLSSAAADRNGAGNIPNDEGEFHDPIAKMRGDKEPKPLYHDPIAKMRGDKEPKPLYRVGDWVTFPYGTIQPVARVIEDRGAIGHKGRRLYRIEFWFPKDVLHQFEMPEEEMSAARAPHETSSTS